MIPDIVHWTYTPLYCSANKLADKKRNEELAQQEKDRQLMAKPAQSLVQQQQERQQHQQNVKVNSPKINDASASSASSPKWS